MGILTKEVEVKPNGKMIQYYKNKGYDAKYCEPLMVKVEDLPKNSHVKLEILCDMCKEETMFVPYQEYNISVEKSGSYVCKKCSPEKVKQNNLKRYGVSNVNQLEETKNKTRITTLKKYGVENYSQTKECHDKMKATMIDRYGVEYAYQMDGYKEKCRNTCIDKYGEDYGKYFAERALNIFKERTGYLHPLQSPNIKEKQKQTNVDKYGVDNPAKSPEVREKMSKTLYANSSQKVSKQQYYINNLYQGILNFPVKYYNVDIYLPEDNLTIEYDGGFHNGRVKTGQLTQEEFDQKEIIRNNVIKREGYKQMRIISYNDKLPSDTILLQMLSDARTYFQTYPSHSWIEFNISTSTVRNAEHKDGIPYDFGALRTIKDNDIQNQSDIEQQQTNKKGA